MLDLTEQLTPAQRGEGLTLREDDDHVLVLRNRRGGVIKRYNVSVISLPTIHRHANEYLKEVNV